MEVCIEVYQKLALSTSVRHLCRGRGAGEPKVSVVPPAEQIRHNDVNDVPETPLTRALTPLTHGQGGWGEPPGRHLDASVTNLFPPIESDKDRTVLPARLRSLLYQT